MKMDDEFVYGDFIEEEQIFNKGEENAGRSY